MMTMSYVIFSLALTALNVGAIAWIMLNYVPRQLRSFAERQEIWQAVEKRCVHIVGEGVVQRALVLKLSNGGGEPTSGTTYYATAMTNVTHDTVKHHPVNYDAVEVDAAYTDMVIRLKKEKRVQLLVEIMPPVMLRDFYREEGVKFSELYYLCSTPDATYFASFATYTDVHLQPAWGDMARTVSDVRKLLKRAYPNAK